MRKLYCMPKTDNGGQATWRKKDAAYRKQEKARRQVNAKRREEVAEAAARGVPVEQVRREAQDE